jgi:IS605 OrfB family transposase
MKLTLQLQLLPAPDQKATLLATMERFNQAATFAAKVGFEAGVFSAPSIQKRCYREIRERFGLSAQMAVRAIGKAVEAFATLKAKGRKECPSFKPRGALTYDNRILSFKGLDKVSLWTLAGRLILPMVYGAYQSQRFDRLKGQVDLVYRKGKFFLYATVDLPDHAPIEPTGFLGVDLGIVNIATDSDGASYSGEAVERIRRRHHENRRRFQKRATKGAKKRLKQLAGREAGFRKHQNHCISKALVQKAKGTDRGVALEDLNGIRERATVRAKDRAGHSGWSFHQLRAFVEYKAKLAGVPIVIVDPRGTSRTCSVCGHCEKANRKSQAEFCCQHCGYSTNADFNGARNIRDRGECKAPSKLDIVEAKTGNRTAAEMIWKATGL